MSRKTAPPTESEIRAQINREFDRWNDLAINGCTDPFWADGVNMNLTRNHILCGYSQLAELGLTIRDLLGEYPEERPVPPRVPMMYMVRDGQSPDRLKKTCSSEQLERLAWGYSGQYQA